MKDLVNFFTPAVTDVQDGSADEKQQRVNRMEMLKAEDIALSVACDLPRGPRTNILSMQVKPHFQQN